MVVQIKINETEEYRDALINFDGGGYWLDSVDEDGNYGCPMEEHITVRLLENKTDLQTNKVMAEKFGSGKDVVTIYEESTGDFQFTEETRTEINETIKEIGMENAWIDTLYRQLM